MAFGWDDIKDFFTDNGTGIDKLDWSRILGTAGGAALLYGLTNKDILDVGNTIQLTHALMFQAEETSVLVNVYGL